MQRATAGKGPVINGAAVAFVLDRLLVLGVDGRGAAEKHGVSLPALMPLKAPLSLLYDLWEAVCAEHGLQHWGLRIAQLLRVSDYSVFGQLLSTSATLGEAVLLATRLTPLVADTISVSFTTTGNSASITIEPMSPELLHPESTELIVATCGMFGRTMTGEQLLPTEVWLTHGSRGDQTFVERFFGGTVRYRAAKSGYVFDSASLALPVRSHDEALRERLSERAEILLKSAPDRSELLTRIQEAIALELCGGDPTADRVAHRLGMHVKTLGRQLRALGTSFRKVLETLRHAQAEEQLTHTELAIEQIALLLGYAEKSAFNRAFKRWTGSTPAEFRAQSRS